MPRLPTPGGDDDTWGGILNDYLGVEHNDDGSLKRPALGTNIAVHGAVGDGVADDTTAIQAAITAAGADGIVTGRPGMVCKVSATVRFTGNVDLRGVTFNWTGGNGDAVIVGQSDATVEYKWKTVFLPRVVQSAKTWGGTDIGVCIQQCYACDIWVPHVQGFSVGLDEAGGATGTGDIGTAYNTIRIGHLDNNQVNQRLKPRRTASFVNQNTHIGGRFSHNTGEAALGTKHTQLARSGVTASDYQPNNNGWLNPSLEGLVVEYDIDGDCANCRWIISRHEGDGTVGDHKARFAGTSADRRAMRNVIETGFEGQNLVLEEGANAAGNSLVVPGDFQRLMGGSADGVVAVANYGSNNNAGLIVGDYSTFHTDDLATAYMMSIASTRTRWKSKTATEPIAEMSNFGQLLRGTGTAAPITGFLHGSGSPEGVQTAGLGSIYQDRAGIGLRSVWYKAVGSGNTGWQPLQPRSQTIATDAAFTLTPHTSPEETRHTGTLTADRAVTLSTVNAQLGQKFRITRTGSGAFNLNVGTGPLKALATNTWAEFVYDGAAWYLAAAGAL